ncbi:hypothetical protein NE236_17440 [Actinoallomurus purpureus]|uniref:hypothetical protein n=1 Tax=Actinoallomurus purpureus TaxID=478114 RepID=UPI002093C3AD|nr:hypothetical protein [Actinoallomurus purpureus]MCO6006772.1 hypothetical protein [Actinoallomurus purpureus]
MAASTHIDTEISGDGIHHLEGLAERLRGAGWYARVIASPGGAGLVRVVNPSAPPLNDDITVGPDQAGLWWFRWSFGTRIAHVENPDIAAARIIQVLGCPSR